MNQINIIAFNGPPSSGKDTACSLLKYNLASAGYNVFQIAFATPIKKGVHSLLNISPEEIHTYGKDVKYPQFNNNSLRDLYNWYSEETKKKLGNLFLNRTKTEILSLIENKKNSHQSVLILISDLGLPEEWEMLKSLPCSKLELVQLSKKHCNFTSDIRNYISEPEKQITLIENNSDIEDFKSKLCNFVIEKGFVKWTAKTPKW